MDIRRIDARIAVSPQIDPADIPAIKAAGFTAIVNNRPDGEEPGQPSGDAVRAAAEDAGRRPARSVSSCTTCAAAAFSSSCYPAHCVSVCFALLLCSLTSNLLYFSLGERQIS